MKILSSFYPNVRTTNHLIPKIFDRVSLVHVHSPGENWTQEQSSVFLWDIPQLKMAIIVTIHHPKFFVSVDVTFNESESYFLAPYLQGKNSIEKDKDRDSVEWRSEKDLERECVREMEKKAGTRVGAGT